MLQYIQYRLILNSQKTHNDIDFAKPTIFCPYGRIIWGVYRTYFRPKLITFYWDCTIHEMEKVVALSYFWHGSLYTLKSRFIKKVDLTCRLPSVPPFACFLLIIGGADGSKATNWKQSAGSPLIVSMDMCKWKFHHVVTMVSLGLHVKRHKILVVICIFITGCNKRLKIKHSLRVNNTPSVSTLYKVVKNINTNCFIKFWWVIKCCWKGVNKGVRSTPVWTSS